VILQTQSDRYYKSFSTFDELIRLLFSVFEKIYFTLLAYFAPILSDYQKEGVSFEQFFAFDSTAREGKKNMTQEYICNKCPYGTIDSISIQNVQETQFLPCEFCETLLSVCV
jgi:uncharacterized protein YutD